MALSFSQFPVSSSFSFPASRKVTPPSISFQIKPTPIFHGFLKHNPITTTSRKNQFAIIIKSSQEDPNSITGNASESERETITTQQTSPTEPPREPTNGTTDYTSSEDVSDLGAQIKKAMAEREQKEPDFWVGVAEEIREIEWPAFNKVLGTTGIVLGVIAGSSVVLLTVNAVLAELSDRVFAGRGVQDFFG
ncbi:unnamed protein product [Ilex paraguariensis]|uniref:Preprotein translocase subunit SECE1 n=1 Tax=Ilex paraguariensis TaxID=185542 RepID=A0ABC8SB42_9AQUA